MTIHSDAAKDFDRLLRRSWNQLKSRQERLKSAYGFGSYERFDLDQDSGTIVFSDRGVPKLIADFQIVGTTSDLSGTWLWAWANSSLDSALAGDAALVREFGERKRYGKLTEASWPGEDIDGWEMTALQAEIVKADGAYRAPHDAGAVFVTLKNVRWPHAVH